MPPRTRFNPGLDHMDRRANHHKFADVLPVLAVDDAEMQRPSPWSYWAHALVVIAVTIFAVALLMLTMDRAHAGPNPDHVKSGTVVEGPGTTIRGNAPMQLRPSCFVRYIDIAGREVTTVLLVPMERDRERIARIPPSMCPPDKWT